ncbi:BspA family leucine-rich repeat surface protein [Flavobacterium sp. CAU 1735]|uniref:BspA family leucine-rich repeat surface protein n=1 Tax=Flavobacterium sp. CAU 1735 TaxID=3140361 RepID=UPI00325FF38A
MGTVADKLTHLGQTKAEIRDAILSKGVAVPVETTFRDYAGKIREITADNGGINPEEEWKRPDDWLPIEDRVVAGDQKFVGLHAIFEDSNFVALSATGNYTVDWGDGKIENFTGATVAYHTYSYADFEGTESVRGYRQAIVTVTPQPGQNLMSVNLQQKHNQAGLNLYYSTGWLDIRLSGQYIGNLIVGGTTVYQGALEAFCFLGDNIITSYYNLFANCRILQSVLMPNTSNGEDFSFMFSACYALKTVSLPSTAKGGNFNYMFQGCNSLKTILELDTSGGVSFRYMFSGCGSLETIPLLNTSSGRNFDFMFDSCSMLRKVPLLNTANGIYFQYMFAFCSSLQTIPLLNTVNGKDFSGMFMNCRTLRTIPLLNTVNGTNFGWMFVSNYLLESVPLLNTANGTNFNNMFEGCVSLETIPALNTSKGIGFNGMFSSTVFLKVTPLLDTSNGIDFMNMFANCRALQTVPMFNTSNGLSFDNMFGNCTTLIKATFLGTKNSISYQNCRLSRAALVSIFSNLASGVQSKTITITNNWGALLLTSEDRDIAIKKGWTIVG